MKRHLHAIAGTIHTGNRLTPETRTTKATLRRAALLKGRAPLVTLTLAMLREASNAARD